VGDQVEWLPSTDEGTIEKFFLAATCFIGKMRFAPNLLPPI